MILCVYLKLLVETKFYEFEITRVNCVIPSDMVYFAFLFNCTPAGQTSDSMTVLT